MDEAKEGLCTLWEDNRLRDVFDRKPTQADIISVFKGKTQWHLTYAKAFPKLSGYPEMVSWLEDSDQKLSDLELWGTLRSTYIHILRSFRVASKWGSWFEEDGDRQGEGKGEENTKGEGKEEK